MKNFCEWVKPPGSFMVRCITCGTAILGDREYLGKPCYFCRSPAAKAILVEPGTLNPLTPAA